MVSKVTKKERAYFNSRLASMPNVEKGEKRVIKKGDRIWNIAKEKLGPNAGNTELTNYMYQVAKVNEFESIEKLNSLKPKDEIYLPRINKKAAQNNKAEKTTTATNTKSVATGKKQNTNTQGLTTATTVNKSKPISFFEFKKPETFTFTFGNSNTNAPAAKPTAPAKPAQVAKQASAAKPTAPAKPTQVAKQAPAAKPTAPAKPTQVAKQAPAAKPKVAAKPTEGAKPATTPKPKSNAELGFDAMKIKIENNKEHLLIQPSSPINTEKCYTAYAIKDSKKILIGTFITDKDGKMKEISFEGENNINRDAYDYLVSPNGNIVYYNNKTKTAATINKETYNEIAAILEAKVRDLEKNKSK